jgi:hypothetical protein
VTAALATQDDHAAHARTLPMRELTRCAADGTYPGQVNSRAARAELATRPANAAERETFVLLTGGCPWLYWRTRHA